MTFKVENESKKEKKLYLSMADADMSITLQMYFDKYLLETASIKRSIFMLR
jgi:hypothetical protein